MASSSTYQMVPHASSFSSNSTSRRKYDVFLSFRGEDTRKNFTDHLYAALVRAGINTFRDDDELQKGEEIGPELLKAIEESRFSIIVLSKNYASSTWCLDELEHILACKKTGLEVWPIFYDVQPSDVGKQKRSFDEAFREHEDRFKDDLDKVRRWRAALKEVAKLKGVDIQNQADGHEAKNIDNIVKEISDKLNRTKLSVAIHPVGLRSRAEKVISMLFNESLDVCIVGIYGIGGIGKTTVVKEVYNSISHKFKACCFLADVRENSDPKGIIQLQRQLLSETLMGKCEKIYNVHRGLKVIEERLCHEKILIVLDDVDDELNQLNQVLGDRSWLCPGSKVIITTRTKDLLKISQSYKQYEVQELNPSESRQLLNFHAFGMVDPRKDYMGSVASVVCYSSGIPLVLEVLGSSLSGEHIDVWNSVLEKLKVTSKEEIHTRLKISYDSLDPLERSLFLDCACFFIGFDKDYVTSILHDCGFFPIAGINKLMKRCLIDIDSSKKLRMHDLLRDMGREIVRRESPIEPGNRSRLWRHEDAIDVLTNKTGTKEIEGLILNLPGESEKLSTKAFKKMKRLRLLQLNHVRLTGSFKFFSRELRWLCWHWFPLGSIPTNLHLGNLVSLDMKNSKLNQFQEDLMHLDKLKFLDFSGSRLLTKISNFDGFPILEILSLENCTSLVELDDSISFLMRLHSLNLGYCKSLRSLPKGIGKLRSLKVLKLDGCSKLKEVPKAIVNLENLEIFSFGQYGRTASPRKGPCIINVLPACLKKLVLRHCNFLPDDGILHCLSGLTLLESLDLSWNNFVHLPATSICSLPKLKKLCLGYCGRLQTLPELPSSLTVLSLHGCPSLKNINLMNFQDDNYLDLADCPQLKEVEGYFILEPIRIEIVENLLRARGLFTSEYITSVRMVMYNFITWTHRKSPLQALYEGGIYSIFLPLSEIPSWFNHRSEGNKISLHLPALEQGSNNKIIGFIMCVVYGLKDVPTFPRAFPRIHVKIELDKLGLHYYPTVFFLNEFDHDVMWLSYWELEKWNTMYEGWTLQSLLVKGIQVNVSIYTNPDTRVKRCGIYWLYEHNDLPLPTISCANPIQIRTRSSFLEERPPEVMPHFWRTVLLRNQFLAVTDDMHLPQYWLDEETDDDNDDEHD